ncbi:MAG: NUDIX domain-containing protein [Candidatus Woesearchaeota archaeon]|nr:MAG: NUDIX domain-containing protein [Candidatus Woesearchaeota archaeon]
MTLLTQQTTFDREAAGCVLLYDGKFLLVFRSKDNVWNSVTRHKEKESSQEAIEREIFEEIGLHIKPTLLTTLFHQYGSKVVKYDLFTYVFVENPLPQITLSEEHTDVNLFTLQEALQLQLYEDEDYCLRLVAREKIDKVYSGFV